MDQFDSRFTPSYKYWQFKSWFKKTSYAFFGFTINASITAYIMVLTNGCFLFCHEKFAQWKTYINKGNGAVRLRHLARCGPIHPHQDIPDPGSWIPDSASSVLDPASKILDPGSSLLHQGVWIWILHPGSWIRHPPFSLSEYCLCCHHNGGWMQNWVEGRGNYGKRRRDVSKVHCAHLYSNWSGSLALRNPHITNRNKQPRAVWGTSKACICVCSKRTHAVSTTYLYARHRAACDSSFRESLAGYMESIRESDSIIWER